MKKIITQIIAGLVIFMMSFSVIGIARASVTSQTLLEKVRICHRTNSVTNPYRSLEVPRTAVDGIGKNDHTLHTGPIFDPDTDYPTPHKGDQWGDIIPPHPGNSLNWPAGETIWENDCVIPTQPVDLCTNLEGIQTEIPNGYEDPNNDKVCTRIEESELDDLVLSADCSNQDGLSKWRVNNPNDKDVPFSYEVRLAEGSDILATGSGIAGALSDTIFETTTPGEIKVTIYWDGDGKEPAEHACATNEDVNVCPVSTPTPSPEITYHASHGSKTKITPQVLGTVAPAPASEALPVAGADYTWIYYFILIASLLGTYYLKQIGWAKITR